MANATRRSAALAALNTQHLNYAGVPQGTKLGPILFVIMINDLKLGPPRCSYWKYVDDITISEFAAARGVSILQSELDNISTWAATNNMVLNPKKCKEMTWP